MRGVLSDKDVSKKLGIDIFIYPFKEENLKGLLIILQLVCVHG